MTRKRKQQKRKHYRVTPQHAKLAIGARCDHPRPECGAGMYLMPSRYGLFYGCQNYPKCRGSHGAHQHTGQPLGVPANAATKQLRIRLHEVFDPLWKTGGMTRNDAYASLARLLGISRAKCHIGMFSEAQCRLALHLLQRKPGDVGTGSGVLLENGMDGLGDPVSAASGQQSVGPLRRWMAVEGGD